MSKVPPATCPHCGYKLDAAESSMTADPPVPGDYSVCAKCQTFLTFQNDMIPRLVTEEEMAGWSMGLRSSMMTLRTTLAEFNANSPSGGFGKKGKLKSGKSKS